MNNKVSLIAAVITTLFAAPSSAAMINVDWKVEGDSRAFLDEETDIEWLKFSNTKKQSITSALSEIGEGGIYEGWRLAKRSEINDLFDTIYPRWDASANGGVKTWHTDYTGGDYWAYSSVYTPFKSLFGWSHTNTADGGRDNHYRSFGLYENDHSDPAIQGDYLMAVTYFTRNQTGSTARHHDYTARIYEDWYNTKYTADFSDVKYSVFLVSDGGVTLSSITNPELNKANANAPINAVPAPASLSLLGIGLVAMTLRRRQNQPHSTTLVCK